MKPHAIELLPDLEVFWSRHASKKHADKSEFKYALSKCFDAKCGNISSYNQRLMVKPSLYEGKNCITLPLLALQKLIQCVDVKQNLKENRVFAGGYFFGCEEPQRNPRDTIFLTDTSDGEPFKVRNFAQLDLDDSPSFLKPFTLACVLYEQKANHGEKTELTTSSTNAFLLWQECAQGDDNDVYFEVGEPRESEGGGGSGSRSRKPGSGKVARRQLHEHLGEIARALARAHLHVLQRNSGAAINDLNALKDSVEEIATLAEYDTKLPKFPLQPPSSAPMDRSHKRVDAARKKNNENTPDNEEDITPYADDDEHHSDSNYEQTSSLEASDASSTSSSNSESSSESSSDSSSSSDGDGTGKDATFDKASQGDGGGNNNASGNDDADQPNASDDDSEEHLDGKTKEGGSGKSTDDGEKSGEGGTSGTTDRIEGKKQKCQR